MTRGVDLHCHSTASDGTYSPADVVRLAGEVGLSGIALTDHDTVAGVDEAKATADTLGIDFLTGIEISAEFPSPGTLHILGYGIDPQSAALNDLTSVLRAGRDNRNPRIIARLRELGVQITMEQVTAEANGGVIGRPHIAAVLIRLGYVKSVKGAFERYLAPGGLAYFDKERLGSADAIGRIHAAGGVAVLAHPVQLRQGNDEALEKTIRDLVDNGIDGIEVLHSDHDDEMIERLTRLADRYNLLKTGGSDFHGRHKPTITLGRARGRPVPREFFDALSDAIAARSGRRL